MSKEKNSKEKSVVKKDEDLLRVKIRQICIDHPFWGNLLVTKTRGFDNKSQACSAHNA